MAALRGREEGERKEHTVIEKDKPRLQSSISRTRFPWKKSTLPWVKPKTPPEELSEGSYSYHQPPDYAIYLVSDGEPSHTAISLLPATSECSPTKNPQPISTNACSPGPHPGRICCLSNQALSSRTQSSSLCCGPSVSWRCRPTCSRHHLRKKMTSKHPSVQTFRSLLPRLQHSGQEEFSCTDVSSLYHDSKP